MTNTGSFLPTTSVAVSGQVVSIDTIPNADRIKLASVDCAEYGTWSAVVGLDVTVDQRVSVFLQDAVVPKDDVRFAFMKAHNWRVRMARFRGQPSECLVLPIDTGEPGTDIMLVFGIVKYEKKIPGQMSGVAKGDFPTYVPRTDEPNVQRVRDLTQLIEPDDDWVATIKYDGTSCTVLHDDTAATGLKVCSRNWELEEPTEEDYATGNISVYWKAALALKESLGGTIAPGRAYQMEVFGPGIQKNPMGASEISWRVFTVYDYVNQCRVALTNVPSHLTAKVFASGTGSRTVTEWRSLAEQTTYENASPAEGIVVRDVATGGGKFSFKVINLLYKD